MIITSIKLDAQIGQMTVTCRCPHCHEPSLIFVVNIINVKAVTAECCERVKYLGKGRAADIMAAYAVNTL